MSEEPEKHSLVDIVNSTIDIPRYSSWLVDNNSGAICTFSGTTREWTKGKQTQTLFYECYREMALTEMEKLVSQAQDKWSINKCVLIHRIGEVPLSESSVFVGVSCPHRADSFEACRFLIDQLKEDVPIWKKEHFVGGESEWVGHKKA